MELHNNSSQLKPNPKAKFELEEIKKPSPQYSLSQAKIYILDESGIGLNINQNKVCRICNSSDEGRIKGCLFSPCLCRGEQEYAHEKCLLETITLDNLICRDCNYTIKVSMKEDKQYSFISGCQYQLLKAIMMFCLCGFVFCGFAIVYDKNQMMDLNPYVKYFLLVILLFIGLFSFYLGIFFLYTMFQIQKKMKPSLQNQN